MLALGIAAMAQNLNTKYLEYISKWKEVALQNQADYGIPASITMAQALLESAAGQSELAVKAKNHSVSNVPANGSAVSITTTMTAKASVSASMRMPRRVSRIIRSSSGVRATRPALR